VGVESTESVGAAVGAAGTGSLVAGVGDEALRDACALPVAGAPADDDTPGDALRLAEDVGVGALVVVAPVAPVVPTGDGVLVGFADFAFLVDFADFDGFAECCAVALFVTTGAIAGTRVPALLCQAKATEPPAGTLRASTPSEA
jgi:hypothetical protein